MTGRQFEHLAPVVQTLDSAIHRISITQVNYAIRWIAIYPVDSAIQRLNNPGQKWGQSRSSLFARFRVLSWRCVAFATSAYYFLWALTIPPRPLFKWFFSFFSGMFAIRAERDYVIEEDFMKAARKVSDNKKLESKLDYKPV